jgi:hypothetical protein
MRKYILGIVLAAGLALPASAQRFNLDLPSSVGERAAEVVDVTLDGPMLRLASRFLSDRGDERAVRDMVQKLDGIYVRSYSFEKEGQYDLNVVDRVRGQLGSGWSKIVNVRGKRENVEIYTQMRGEQIVGLVVISAEPRELTLVNIVGPIDLDQLAKMEGQFGLPSLSNTEKDRRGGRR